MRGSLLGKGWCAYILKKKGHPKVPSSDLITTLILITLDIILPH